MSTVFAVNLIRAKEGEKRLHMGEAFPHRQGARSGKISTCPMKRYDQTLISYPDLTLFYTKKFSRGRSGYEINPTQATARLVIVFVSRIQKSCARDISV